MTERVSLPPRPSDGGGLPATEADFAARMANAHDIVLEQILESDRRAEGILESRLEFVRMKIRVAESELERRRQG